MSQQRLKRLVQMAESAADHGYGVLSTGEKLTVALILNRSDWLASMDYTMAEAIGRIDADIVALIPDAARMLADRFTERAEAAVEQAERATLAAIQQQGAPIDLASELVTYGSAPGYRDASLVFDLRPIGRHGAATFRAEIRVRPQDAETIVRHLCDVHRLAWRRGAPLDIQPGEKRPTWIDR